MQHLKTQPTSFRLNPLLVTALKLAAQKEHRSQANMLEVMVREYCLRHGVSLGDVNESEGRNI